MSSAVRVPAAPTVTGWHAALRAARLLEGVVSDKQLDVLAPALVDSHYRENVSRALVKVGPRRVRSAAGLCYAQGYLHARAGDLEAATALLVRAQSLPASIPLSARISAELGYLYVSRGQSQAAEAILVAAQGRVVAAGGLRKEPDLLQLEALIADWKGDRRSARALHKECLATASRALTPLTRVLALSNLAVALAHQYPEDAVSLGRLAIATVESETLNPRVLPALLNATGYAALVTGRFDDAQILLTEAMESARSHANRRIEMFSIFNLAVREELLGRPDRARSMLCQLAETARHNSLPALGAWVELRLRWLNGDADTARAGAGECRSPGASPELGTAFDELAGIEACRGGDLAAARRTLGEARSRHVATEDDLSLFVTDLWLARVESDAGRDARARQFVRSVVRLGRLRGFTLSTNWWAPEILVTARALADRPDQGYVGSLHPAFRAADEPEVSRDPAVLLLRDGAIAVAGVEVSAEIWREGRSGPNVLRRLFCLLRKQYPGGVTRDTVADELWPGSDGDRAVRNVHEAVHDLRRALSAIPGVQVATLDRQYRLRLSLNVAVESAPSRVGTDPERWPR